VGKASRRKRERSQAAATIGTPVTPSARLRRRLQKITILAAGVFAIGLVTWFHYRDSEVRPGPGAVLPDPDTKGITAPVARAIREARQAALARPESAAAVGAFCQVLHAHWLHGEAGACYGVARQLAPEDFRWVYLLAGVEDVRGADGGLVDQLYREAIRLAPRYPPAHVRHADALLRLGLWSEARDAYTAAVKLDPKLVLAQRGLGQAAILLGDGPAAVEHLEIAASLSPQDRIVQVALARAYTLTGQGDLAAEAAHKAQTFDSEASLPDAIFFEIQNLAVDPESLRGRLVRAQRKGDYDAAIKAATLLEESGAPAAMQQLVLSSKQRARQFAVAGDFDAALAEFERAARLAPADPEIEHNWGTVLLRRGDLEGARRHFEKAIELNPQSADSLYNLGVVLEGQGHSDEAVARFIEAAAIDPQHAAAKRLDELGVRSDS
jgi:tetratricopeptide (TPR) repeat protein